MHIHIWNITFDLSRHSVINGFEIASFNNFMIQLISAINAEVFDELYFVCFGENC